MKKQIALLLLMAMVAAYAIAKVGPPQIGFWVDGELYRTVGTPTNLPDKGHKDGIFSFANGEQLSVAEAKPGDTDYNGGRWQVIVVEVTGDIELPLTSWEEVVEQIDLGNVEVVGPGPSFVCPVIKVNKD